VTVLIRYFLFGPISPFEGAEALPRSDKDLFLIDDGVPLATNCRRLGFLISSCINQPLGSGIIKTSKLCQQPAQFFFPPPALCFHSLKGSFGKAISFFSRAVLLVEVKFLFFPAERPTSRISFPRINPFNGPQEEIFHNTSWLGTAP